MSEEEQKQESYTGELVIQELRENVDPDYLNFVDPDFVVCSVCHDIVKARYFAYHIEEYHFEPDRPWNRQKRKRMGIDGPTYLQKRAERWLKKHGYKD
jgi:hypothetical protein